MYPGSKWARIKRPALDEKPRPTVLKKPQSAGLDCFSGFQPGREPFIIITGQWSQKQAGKLFRR